MKCVDLRVTISAYIDEELSLEEKEFIGNHLKSCQVCSEYLAELKGTVAQINSLYDAEPDLLLTQRIMARIREKTKKKESILERLFFPLQSKLLVPAFATIAIALVVIYFYKADPQPKPHTQIAKAPTKRTTASDKPEKGLTAPQEETRSFDNIFGFSDIIEDEPDPLTKNASKKRPSADLDQIGTAPLSTTPDKDISKNGILPAALQKMIKISFVVSTDETGKAVKTLETVTNKLDAKIINKESLDIKNLFIITVDSKKLDRFVKELKLIGSVIEKRKSLETIKGNITVRVDIVEKEDDL